MYTLHQGLLTKDHGEVTIKVQVDEGGHLLGPSSLCLISASWLEAANHCTRSAHRAQMAYWSTSREGISILCPSVLN